AVGEQRLDAGPPACRVARATAGFRVVRRNTAELERHHAGEIVVTGFGAEYLANVVADLVDGHVESVAGDGDLAHPDGVRGRRRRGGGAGLERALGVNVPAVDRPGAGLEDRLR